MVSARNAVIVVSRLEEREGDGVCVDAIHCGARRTQPQRTILAPPS